MLLEMKTHSALVYLGPATSMPGEIFCLVHAEGGRRFLLLDSMLDAEVYAGHFDAEVLFSMPEARSILRAIDYSSDRSYVTTFAQTNHQLRRGEE